MCNDFEPFLRVFQKHDNLTRFQRWGISAGDRSRQTDKQKNVLLNRYRQVMHHRLVVKLSIYFPFLVSAILKLLKLSGSFYYYISNFKFSVVLKECLLTLACLSKHKICKFFFQLYFNFTLQFAYFQTVRRAIIKILLT